MEQSFNSYPTTLSDIQFTQQPDSDLYKTLKSLRKSTLSIPHRLHSIFSDAEFVQSLQQWLSQAKFEFTQSTEPSEGKETLHLDLRWPLIANERAGSWYLSPSLKAGSAYFKSTDGHYNKWDFSLRRLNLPVLELLGTCGCAILIDSTRRGKDFPDALRRTVPIWVQTWNNVLFPEPEFEVFHRLQVKDLEPSEVSQIESRVGSFTENLKKLSLPLEELREKVRKPMRCVWIHNQLDRSQAYELVEQIVRGIWQKYDCNVLVLCSASRRVIGAEMSDDGYIQGAGDDSEGWSCGLTPTLAWKHHDQLLSYDEGSIGELVQRLVYNDRELSDTSDGILISPTETLFIGHRKSTDNLSQRYSLIINCNITSVAEASDTINLGCRNGKLGSKDMRPALNTVKSVTRTLFEKDPTARIFVTCSTGKDLSVGVAVTLLCLFYDDTGQVDLSRGSSVIDKSFVKQRLAWISLSKPDSNPSRSTLQAVHSFLIDRPT